MFLKVLFLPVKCHYINISLLNLANVMYTLIIKLLLFLYWDIIISKNKGGAVSEWVTRQRRNGDRVVLGLNPAGGTSLRNFGNSVYPTLPVSFGGDINTVDPFYQCLCQWK